MANILHDAVLAVDLGKTTCRLRLTTNDTVLAENTGPGAPGLANHDGEELAWDAIGRLTAQLAPNLRSRVDAVGIGAAGVEAGPDAARSLAKRISGALGAPVALINDALAAHVGAFEGGSGTILITGTGAIAFSVDDTGAPRQVDGWGPLLGDDGGGRWIGQEGIRAALRAHDGRSPATSLTIPATSLAGDLESLPRWAADTDNAARRLASFAPTVLSHAEAGDPVARSIVSRSCEHLLETIEAAAPPGQPISIVGGLYEDRYFRATLLAALSTRRSQVREPRGSALDGAALISTDSSLPHESRIIRA